MLRIILLPVTKDTTPIPDNLKCDFIHRSWTETEVHTIPLHETFSIDIVIYERRKPKCSRKSLAIDMSTETFDWHTEHERPLCPLFNNYLGLIFRLEEGTWYVNTDEDLLKFGILSTFKNNKNIIKTLEYFATPFEKKVRRRDFGKIVNYLKEGQFEDTRFCLLLYHCLLRSGIPERLIGRWNLHPSIKRFLETRIKRC